MSLKAITRSLFVIPILLLQAVSAHAATVTFNANLMGSNEVPTVSTSGSGVGTFVFDTVAQNITFNLSYTALSSSANMAHIHFGAVGANGPVILPFSPAPTGTSGILNGVLTSANLINTATSGIISFTDIYNAALAGNLYANLHTVNFADGEVRGQLTQANVATPEPTTALLFCSGLLAMPLLLRKRKQQQ